jgi:hypothetical protein
MTWTRVLSSSALCAALAFGGSAFGQTATQNLPINTGSFSGNLGGTITADVKNTSGAVLDINTLRIITQKTGGGFFNVFPNSDTTTNPAPIPISIGASQVGINIPTTPFNSGITGSFDVTAGDNLANAVPGVLDGGVPGSDGKWDDPGQTGILNNASASNINVSLGSPINATANVSGSIGASIPNNITVPGAVNAGLIQGDLIVKNSSNLAVTFDPVQQVSIQNLSISSPGPVPLDYPGGPGNFVDGAHPVSPMMLDLSTQGADLVSTTISGTLVADITGTISGSIDLAANLRLSFSGININLSTINIDDAVNGVLGGGTLIDLNEGISLSDTELPFVINVIHNASGDVDFDDVAASLMSGSLGLTVPISLSQPGLSIAIPSSPFSIGPLPAIPVNSSGQQGNVIVQTLSGTLGGNINLDLTANLGLQADLVAGALKTAAINVVPEPGSVLLMAFAGLGLAGYGIRRRRK